MYTFNSPKDFYLQRDDRTNQCVEADGYQKVKCLVIASEATANSYSGQVMILTSLNILSRWCRSISIAVPNGILHERLSLSGHLMLHDRIEAEIRDADPFGTFEFVSSAVLFPGKEYDFVLQIGSKCCGFSNIDYSINADGWLAIITQGSSDYPLNYQMLNPVGPAIAACLGVAQAFKKAIGLSPELFIEALCFSAYDFAIHHEGFKDIDNPEVSDIVDLGQAQMVGAGSVGSAFLYFLRMLHTEGTLTIIDHDIVQSVNLNRSPIFGVSNCGESKAIVGTRYFHGSDLTVIPFNGKYADYIKEYGRKKNGIDILFPLANEDNVRWAIENNYPPLMIYGTTTRDWGVNLGRHIPFNDDCLVCRYPEEKKDIHYVCSKGVIPEDARRRGNTDAALPFLSPLSAIFMIAEVIKTMNLSQNTLLR